jgi:adenylate kinase
VPHEPYKTALLMGAPGAGKGTQGAILHTIPGFHHFSMGDAFRGLDPASDLGRQVKTYSSRGELVPDDITVQLLEKSLVDRIGADAYHPDADLLILDGFPRNPNQVRLLDRKVDVVRIVHLQCDQPDALIARLRKRALQQNRADDAKEEVIRRRLEIYAAETQPVIDMYPPAIVDTIDPIGAPAEVLRRVLESLASLQAGLFGNVLAG